MMRPNRWSDHEPPARRRTAALTRPPGGVLRQVRPWRRSRFRPAADFRPRSAAHRDRAITGPVFGFSDTWQLVINTATTIVTFLMVFLIQNTQNRDSEAMQIKLDELIRRSRSARNTLLDLEELTEEELDKIRAEYEELAKEARGKLESRRDRQGRA
jgi:low affinity Fe/Cu permease